MAWGWEEYYGTFARYIFILSSFCGIPWMLYFIRYCGKIKLFKMHRSGSSLKLKWQIRFRCLKCWPTDRYWYFFVCLFSSFLTVYPSPPSPPAYLSSLYSLCNLQEYFLWCIPPGGSQGPECENYLVHLQTQRTWDHSGHCRRLNYVLTACIQFEKH